MPLVMPVAPLAVPTRPWPVWAEGTAVGAFWALFAAIALVRRALDPAHPFSGHTVAVTLVEYGPWLVATPVLLSVTRRRPLGRSRWPARLSLHLAVALAVALAVGTVQRVAIPALGPPPSVGAMPDGRTDGPGPPGGGPPMAAPSLHVLLALFVLGAGWARAAAWQLHARQAEAHAAEAETERLTALLTAARLDALRAQLHPHLLYNALNAVSALAEDDPAAVRRLVARLSALLRRVLDHDPAAEVPLTDELAALDDYAAIQSVRFGERLRMVVDVPEALRAARVPALILQPIVENAVVHGVEKAGRGTVTLHARRDGGPTGLRLVVTVHNTGAPPAADARDSGIGLANTRARLDAHYGDAASVVLRAGTDGGAEAVVSLPYRDPSDA